ncbi:MAG: EF-hand domain-containing protein, partial [Blastocatellia bacterium]
MGASEQGQSAPHLVSHPLPAATRTPQSGLMDELPSFTSPPELPLGQRRSSTRSPLMKRTLLATATSLLLWSSPSWIEAQEENLFERLDTNKDGQVAVDEIDADRRRLFERLLRIGDKNSDGKLSREEFTEAVKVRPNEPAPGAPGDRPNLPEPREVLVRFDKDQDGKLSKEEAPDRLKENFDRVDTNKDGSIDADELRQAFMALARGAGPAGRMTPQIFERMFQERDKNKDGKLTKDEMPEERQEFFARLLGRFDDDGDGALTKEQFVKALQA